MRYIYSLSTPGQKINWMQSNPFVCLEVDEIKSPQD
jgi:nitroimidazol reductase NimA-like FMN-containing flavoprotein (pyridoxamine 5'-phosphate oxidase superfamily)